jgi:hypothetical protein
MREVAPEARLLQSLIDVAAERFSFNEKHTWTPGNKFPTVKQHRPGHQFFDSGPFCLCRFVRATHGVVGMTRQGAKMTSEESKQLFGAPQALLSQGLDARQKYL